jgi:uncharacterized protein with ParB-like and HNH nuclease domain
VSDNQLRNLDKLFERKIFRVPDYQRGYAWGLRQLEDFWEDLMNLDGHRTHYTGVLTLEKINKDKITGDAWEDDVWIIQKGFTPYYIVDGQQRLTTLVILIQDRQHFSGQFAKRLCLIGPSAIVQGIGLD